MPRRVRTFDLVHGGVLRLVEHYHGIVERTATHKCKRRDLYHVALHILLELERGYHILEGIVERLQVRVDFVFHIAGQEAEFLTGLHGRAREDDFAHLAVLEGSHCQGYGDVCFARTGGAECKGEVVFAKLSTMSC